jgi:O-acetyl-ADP-ribose deacetylase (regulator of RNase III)
VKTVAFPAISTGIYGYPKEEAARVASMSIAGVLGADSTLDQVRLVFFAASDAAIFVRHQRFGTD